MAESDSQLHPETIAVHAGRKIDPATGAVTMPILLSTTFQRAEDGSFPSGFDYTRSNNPNRAALENALAALEGGAVAAAGSTPGAAPLCNFPALRPTRSMMWAPR